MASIDERVVKLTVNDREFQQAVDNVIKALSGLKQALKFDNASKGFDAIDKAASRVKFTGLNRNAAEMQRTVQTASSEASNAIAKIGMDTSGLQNAKNSVSSLSGAFTSMQTIATGALLTIGNQAVNTAKSLVSMFTSGITDGLAEYELQMNSIQTIMSNTASKGTTLDQVNSALNELNTYADKTIYNFSEMTRNIGTFTAAGVDLQTSVDSIKGLANLAAASGSSATQAATAMYQLSQAIAAGRVSLMDWNSVVNAGMGGELFQNALKRTAQNMGKDVDGLIAKYGSFRESLTEGQWLTTEVLTETLKQIAGAYNKEQLLAQGYTDQQANDIMNLAKTAEDAATKITTFSKLMDTMGESIGSGWAQTWQLIFGDFEEARTFWSDLWSNTLEPIINNMSDARNALLGGALKGQGSDAWSSFKSRIEQTGASVDDFKAKLNEVASENGKSLDQLIQQYGSFDAVMTSGKISTSEIVEALKRLANGAQLAQDNTAELNQKLQTFQDVVDRVWRGDFANGEDRIKALTEAGYDYAKVQDLVNKTVDGHRLTLEDLGDEQLKAIGYTQEQIDALHNLANEAAKSGSSLNELIESMSRKSGRELLLEGLVNVLQAVLRPLGAIKQAFDDVFGISSDQLYDGIDAFHRLSEALVMSDDTLSKLTRTFRGLFSIFKIFTTLLSGTFGVAFRVVLAILEHFNIGILDVTATLGDLITKFVDFLTSGDLIGAAFDAIAAGASNAFPKVTAFFQSLDQYPLIKGLVDMFNEAKKSVEDYIDSFKGLDVQAVFAKMASDSVPVLKQVASAVKSFASTVVSEFNKAFPQVGQFINSIIGPFSTLGRYFNTAKNVIKNFINDVRSYMRELLYLSPGEALNKIVTDIKNTFGKIDWDDILEGLKNFGDKFQEIFEKIKDGIEDIAPNIIDGLVNGLTNKDGGIFSAIASIGEQIIETIRAVLGIHSPSTVMFEIGQNVVQGLINGIESMIHNVAGLFSTLGAEISGVLGGIDWGSIAIVALGGGLLVGLYKMSDAMQGFATAAKNVTAPIGSAGKFIDSLTNAVNKLTDTASSNSSTKLQKFASAIKTLAESIAILSGVVVVLGAMDSGDLWEGVGAITALVTVMGLLTVAISRFTFGSTVKDVAKVETLMLALSGAFAIFAVASRIMGGIDEKGFEKAASGFIVFGLVCSAIIATVSKFPVSEVAKVSGLITSVSASFILLGIAMRIAGGMSSKEFDQAARAIGGFTAVVMALIAFSQLAGIRIGSIGKTILSISAAFIAMSVAAKILGGMSSDDFSQGLAGVAMFSMLVAGLIAATRLVGGLNVTGIGASILGISAAFVAMAVTAKILGSMSWDEFRQGIVGVGIFSALVVAMIGLTNLVSNGQMIKVGASILAISAAIGILALTAAIIGNLDPDKLRQGFEAVTLLGGVVVALMYLTKNLKGAEKASASILAMSASIGILAAAVAVLSLIDPKKLVAPVAAIGVLMSLFALVVKAGSAVQSSMGSLIVMTVAIGLIGGMIALLTLLDPKELLASATALGEAMVALGAAFALVGKAGDVTMKSMASLAVMLVIVAALGGVIAALAALPIGSTLPIAASLSVLLLSMSAALNILAAIGPKATAALPAAGTLGIILGAMGAIIGIVGVFDQLAGGGVTNAVKQGGKVLEALGEAIGGFFGGLAAGAIKSIGGALPELATDLSTFMENLDPFIDGAQKVQNANIGSAIKDLSEAILMLSGSSFLDAITNILTLGGGGIDDLGDKIVPLADAMVDFSNKCVLINAEAMDNGVKGAKGLAKVLNAMPKSGGLWGMLSGNQDWDQLSSGLKGLGKAMAAFSEAVSGENFDTTALDSAIPYIKKFINALKSMPKSGGLSGILTGDEDWSQLSEGLKGLGKAMSAFSTSISGEGFNAQSIADAMPAVKAFIKALKDMPKSGGISGFLTGDQDWNQLSNGLKGLGTALKSFSDELGGEEFNAKKIQRAAEAIKTFAEASQNGSFASFTIPKDLESQMTSLGKGLGAYGKAVKDINLDAIEDSEDALVSIADTMESLGSIKNIKNVANGFIDTARSLGEGLSAYAEQVGSIDEGDLEAIITAKKAMTHVKDMVVDLAGVKGGINEATFGFITDANQLGVGLRQYAEEVGNISDKQFEAVDKAKKPLSTMAKMVSDLSDVDVSDASLGFITDANQLGVGLRQYAEEVGNISDEQFTAVSNSKEPMENLASMISDLADTDSISGVSKGFITDANQLGVGLRQYAEEVSNIADMSVVSASIEPMNQLASLISNVSDTEFVDISKGFITSANQMGAGLQQYASHISEVNFEQVSASIQPLSSLAQALGSLPEEYPDIEGFKKALNDISSVDLAKFGSDFAANAQTAQTNVNNMITVITDGSNNLNNAISGLRQTLSTSDIGSGLVNALSSAASSVSTQSSNIQNTLNSLASFVTNFGSTWGTAFQPMYDATTTQLTRIKQNIDGFQDDFKTAGSNLTKNLADGLKQNRDSIKTTFNQVLNSAANSAKSYYSSFYTTGTYLASGFAKGISAGTSAAVNAAANMAAKAIAAAQKAQDSHSPSKVTQKLGKWFTQGYSLGMKSEINNVSKTAREVVSSSIDTFRDLLGDGTTANTFGVESTPTITPVFDLSKAQYQARSINAMLPSTMSLGGVSRLASDVKMTYYPDNRMEEYSAKMASENAALRKSVDELRGDMSKYTQAINDQEISVNVDGKKLASAIAKPMNQELGIRSRRGSLSRV